MMSDAPRPDDGARPSAASGRRNVLLLVAAIAAMLGGLKLSIDAGLDRRAVQTQFACRAAVLRIAAYHAPAPPTLDESVRYDECTDAQRRVIFGQRDD